LYYVYGFVSNSKFHLRVAGPLVVATLFFFGGVELGLILEAEEAHAEPHGGAHIAAHGTATHDENEHAHAEDHSHATAVPQGVDLLPSDAGPVHDVAISPAESATPDSTVNQKGMAGLFFSIYYCMTGVHAFHILGGMVVITWLIVKSARLEFHDQYYGPVDNVGLYWHLVDFIWIYLFPLLYLIT